MKGFQFHPKSLTFSLVITILLLGSSFGVCSARRGRHWRHGASVSASLYKKKGRSHSHSSGQHHGSKQKTKTPSYKPPTTPTLPPPESPPPGQITPLPPPSEGPYKDSPSSFNVLDFGAKGDAISDDTKAFEAAWAAACKVEASTMIVPSGYQFLVGPISFSGPYCMPNIVFQLDGKIIAPTSTKVWGSGLLWWIEFTKLKGITIQGGGIIDGSGSVWWTNSPYDSPVDSESQLFLPLNDTTLESPPMPVRSQLSQKMPSIKPTALRFYGSYNVTVTGITIQNSQQCHLKFDNCAGVTIHDMNVTSPADSPNTDGIHLQNSQQVNIHHTDIACGDDCVSIQTGCSNVYIHNINCGPGHGISIGSLGKDNTKACVSNVTVRDVQMYNTMTGVRIKTWQGGSGSVQNVMFSNIVMTEVQLPIMIDQFYCDKRACKNQSDAVSVSGVTYERIRGTYTVKPVHLACSDEFPCTDITFTSVQLRPLQEKYPLNDAFCSQAYGVLTTPIVPPVDCLQIGKPAKNLPLSQFDLCMSS